MGLIKTAVALGGIYFIAKKVTEKQQNGHCRNQQQPQQQVSRAIDEQSLPASVPQTKSMVTSGAAGHASYCNGQCGGRCSFNASEQYGYEGKAPVYEEKAF
jgi:hypothetical protein